ncbi:class F sortase [Streptomyces sp. NPDC002564]|uniref:class F sortase n=1 Tax=Streptomyces sp. NPDC002564 TaxID=3364649 RepID=UPI00367E665D
MAYSSSSTARSVRSRTSSWVLFIIVIVGLVNWMTDGQETKPPPRPTAAQGQAAHDPVPETPPLITSLPEASPVRIAIPSIDVDAPLTDLARNAGGGLDPPPPDDADLAGWDAAGIMPGSTGTAVIAGHVDTQRGPAVFYGLGSLEKGALIEVARADGLTAHFTVDGVEEYERTNFPDAKVYGQRTRPELRLITCGGNYTKTDGYSGNVVVYAHLTGAT